MKLLIILSALAISYAEKLDRAYLPPASAALAGGSPGSLTAPGSQPGSVPSNAPSAFGQPASSSLGQPSLGQGPTQGLSPTGQPYGASSGQPGSTGQPSATSFGQPSFGQGPAQGLSPTGQPARAPLGQTSGTSFGQPSYGQGPAQGSPQAGSAQPGLSGTGQFTPQQYNQAGVSPQTGGQGYGQASGFNQSPAFGGQAQYPSTYSGQTQPERARASLDRNAEILRYDNQIDGDRFAYSFETSNGISAEESGTAANGVRAQGAFAYTGDDGQQYRVTYTADENGYQPRGDHLPTPPPIPNEILKSLEDNARAAAAGTQEGAYNPAEDLEVAIEPQQYSGSYPSRGQPGQTAMTYQPGQGSSPFGIAGLGQQGYQIQAPTSQYNAPGSLSGQPGTQSGSSPSNAQYGAPSSTASSPTSFTGLQSSQSPNSPRAPLSSLPSATPGFQRNPSQSNQLSGSQFASPGSTSGSALSESGYPSQGTKSSSSGPAGSLSSSVMPGKQGSNQDAGYQYAAPGSLSGPGRFGVQGSQGSAGRNPATGYSTPGLTSSEFNKLGTQGYSQGGPSSGSQFGAPTGSQGNSVLQSQAPLSSAGLNSGNSGINKATASYNGPSATPSGASGSRFPSQGVQNSGYNYNAPTISSLSGPTGSNLQNNPSEGNQGVGAPGKTSFGASPFGRPQESASLGSQASPLQSTPASLLSQGVRPQFGQSSPSGSQGYSPQGTQAPRYDTPSSIGSGSTVPGQQSQSQFNQRPSFGSSLSNGPAGSRPQGQARDDGYQYNQPQIQFNRPSGSGFSRPSGTGLASVSSGPFNQQSNGLPQGSNGNDYSATGPSASRPTSSSNTFGSSNPTRVAAQGYPSGPASLNNAPAIVEIGTGFPRPTQYTPVGSTSGPTSSSFTRPTQYTPVGPTTSPTSSGFPKPGGTSGAAQSFSQDSAPYQYNRPGTQGPSGTAQNSPSSQPGGTFGTSNLNNQGQITAQTGFGPSGQNQPGQRGSQSTSGYSSQDRPSESGSQSSFGGSQGSFGLTGQGKPTESFEGPRQPPSFSDEEGYKY